MGTVPAAGASPILRLVITYLMERKSRGELSKATVDTYRFALFSFADSFGRRLLNQLSRKAVERWLETIANLARGTRRLRLSIVKGFAEWCVVEGKVPRDFTAGLRKIPVPRAVPRDLTIDHFQALLAACEDDRERAVLWLLYGCGLRCVEVSRLDVPDYDPGERVLHVVGKAGHERHVPVPAPVHRAIQAYLVSQRAPRTGPLMRNITTPTRLSPNRIAKLTAGLFARSGVKVRPHDGRSAHGLRAAAASDLLDQCEDVRVAQQFLGHKNVATTSRYLRRRTLASIREANDARFEANQ